MSAKFTSASANKYLKSLQEEKDFLLATEKGTCEYTCAAGEEADPPLYSYNDTSQALDEIDEKMLLVRHAIHQFNIQTLLPQHGISIDEALIRMAQLSNKKSRLSSLRRKAQKARNRGGFFMRETTVVEYTYANYDVEKAGTDYKEVCSKIEALQLELDLINQTHSFEIEL